MTDSAQQGSGRAGPTPAAPPPTSGAPGSGDRFFDWNRSTGIVRGSDRWFAGVCGGIARRAGLNPLLVRVIAIVLAVLGGPVLFVYVVGWALLPDAQGRIHAEQALRGVFEPVMIVIVAVLAISFVSYSRDLWWQNPQAALGLPVWLSTTLAVGWSIGVTIGIIWLVVFLVRRTSAPPGTYQRHGAVDYPAGFADEGANARRGAAAGQAGRGTWRDRRQGAGFSAIVLGLALTGGAVTAGLWSAGTWSTAALIVGLAVTVGVLALGVIISGIRGREGGAMGGLAFLAAAALVLLGVFPGGTAFFPVGAPVWTVSPVAAGAPPGYVVLAGKSTIDLSRLDEPGGSDERTIDIWMGMGVTELILPTDRAVQVEAGAFIGGINYSADPSSQGLGGLFFHDQRAFNDDGTRAMPRIRVWTFLGQVTIANDNGSPSTSQENR
ncbi:PspC domain-containing protein [Cryobacterium sp. PH31-AA6]|uniref:PspC domain-containing protein n=1 Tax=Cryobacterium sp. PH31-AA6 TaxID=3046205 RepID=UPI0024BA9734|nr:PspC domain-containing protein [Cryobacterium sp. PH31-AA6]MDJ0323446.1 PspC domain-containing protein [Cryobacterium sp. PH31-AA6]